MKLEYGKRTIDFSVDYRKRKTFEIRIEPPGIVKVAAPRGTDEATLLNVVRSKAEWIIKKLFEIKDIEHRRYIREYVNGESFMYLGRNYPLRIITDETVKRPWAKLYQGKFYIISGTDNQSELKKAMERWYRQKTLEKVGERVNYYQSYFDQKPNSIYIKEQKKRWGSCSSKKNLNFNWRCSMAPMPVLDYIVVHEMCHLVHFNHSREFWNLVRAVMPDYGKRKEWLRNFGVRMDL